MTHISKWVTLLVPNYYKRKRSSEKLVNLICTCDRCPFTKLFDKKVDGFIWSMVKETNQTAIREQKSEHGTVTFPTKKYPNIPIYHYSARGAGIHSP